MYGKGYTYHENGVAVARVQQMDMPGGYVVRIESLTGAGIRYVHGVTVRDIMSSSENKGCWTVDEYVTIR